MRNRRVVCLPAPSTGYESIFNNTQNSNNNTQNRGDYQSSPLIAHRADIILLVLIINTLSLPLPLTELN